MIKKTFLLITILLMALGSWLLYGTGGVYAPVTRPTDEAVILKKGMGMVEVADLLVQKKLVANKYVFFLASVLGRQWGKVKAGEFLIPNHARPVEIIRILCCGKVIVHKITFPEGNTVADHIEQINKLELLTGEIEHIPAEGFMLPETYTYVYGDTRQSLVNRMEAAMVMALADVWGKRKEELPYKTSLEALTLASIVEKETGRHDERKRIAGVFINRLNKGMRLQADPTVVYGITLGKSKLGRKITKQDLRSATIYNTYIVDGLPPRPICCPGRAAIQAALDPLISKELFFVANGLGGHNFSASLTQHNAFVDQYRRMGG
ncbi:MAG: endolytic transglycosylase MltG [Candidatus Paracaedibacteraceae bacterium]|nr:endolytic transglycosylase MltG [Candidatus Paracaedibacteraceae bacterium]